ncbi:MAG TPA: ABC transporter substrate-binding protein [Bacteroidales bacterium]|nr:ABC transporter substrate-binding protein [Bacteroidales bacterium]
MKQHTFFFAVLLLFAVCGFGCKSGPDQSDKKIFKYNESVGITSLDPAFSSGQATLWPCNLLYNGLVDLDEQLRVVPMIAKRWEISEDGTLYTFYLRDDVYFHDGGEFQFPEPRLVVAEDFVYSLSRILDPEVASPGAWIFRQVALDENGKPQFIAVDDTTFQIRLSAPFPPFINILSMKYCSVVPKEVVEKYGKEFRKHPVGTGPFRFQLWEEGIKLVLRKNEHYFEKDEQGNALPYLDGVAITFISDKQAMFMEFMKGNLDLISGLDACYKDALLTRDGNLKEEFHQQIRVQKAPYLNTEYLGFLHKENKSGELNPLLIKEVREAINYGIDREKMIRYLRNGIGNPHTHGFVPAGLPSFDTAKVKGYQHNPQKSAALLAKAGFPGGQGLPPIPLSVSSGYLDLIQYIQHELGKLGIQIKIDVQQAAQQREMMRNYQLPFFRGSWIADYPDAENYLALFYSKNLQPVGSNYTHYVNLQFDALFEKSQQIIDPVERNKAYTQLDSLLMADAPVVILFYDQVIRFVQQNISEMEIPATNMLELRRVKKE